MPSVFDYQDYRRFLADYYEEKKADSSAFSYQNFSRKAGFTSKSFVFEKQQYRLYGDNHPEENRRRCFHRDSRC